MIDKEFKDKKINIIKNVLDGVIDKEFDKELRRDVYDLLKDIDNKIILLERLRG